MESNSFGIISTNIHNLDEIIPGLYISSEETAYSKDKLISAGIKAIISLTNYTPFSDDPQFKYLSFNFEDDIDVPILPIIYQSCNFINDNLQQNNKILVHCSAGVSRSGSVIVGYLMMSNKLDYYNALLMAKSVRPYIQPNPGFEMQLKLMPNLVNKSVIPYTEPIYSVNSHLQFATIDHLIYNSDKLNNTCIHLFDTGIYYNWFKDDCPSNLIIYQTKSSNLVDILDINIDWAEIFSSTNNHIVIGTTIDMKNNLICHYTTMKNGYRTISSITQKDKLVINYYLTGKKPSKQIDELLLEIEQQIKLNSHVSKLLSKLYDIYCITFQQKEIKKRMIHLLENS